MTLQRTALHLFLAPLVSLLLASVVNAHGGVVQEDDLCVIKVDYLRAHFKVYQPRSIHSSSNTKCAMQFARLVSERCSSPSTSSSDG